MSLRVVRVSRVQDAGQPVRTKDPLQGPRSNKGKPGRARSRIFWSATARELKAVKDELERQRKQSEIQQKQIETLERAARLLAEQIKKPTGPPGEVEKLQSQTAVLTARTTSGPPRQGTRQGHRRTEGKA